KLQGAMPQSDKGAVFATYGANDYFLVELVATAVRNQNVMDAWTLKAWQTIHDAAFERYRQQLAVIQEERDNLFRDLTNKDTLSLRRLEREELIRSAMDWLVGPTFTSAPPKVAATLKKIEDWEAAPGHPFLIALPGQPIVTVEDPRSDI